MANGLCKRGASRDSALGRFPPPPKGHYAPWGILPRPDHEPRHRIPIRIAGTTVAQPEPMDLGVRYPKMAVSLALFAAGCATNWTPAIRRASREFACPEEKIVLIERADLSDDLFDIEACGHRARYMCVFAGKYQPNHCIREPDPPRWDPDPKDVETLANRQQPSSAPFHAPSSPSQVRHVRVCHDRDESESFHDCILLH
jgi:hypothetical protein